MMDWVKGCLENCLKWERKWYGLYSEQNNWKYKEVLGRILNFETT